MDLSIGPAGGHFSLYGGETSGTSLRLLDVSAPGGARRRALQSAESERKVIELGGHQVALLGSVFSRRREFSATDGGAAYGALEAEVRARKAHFPSYSRNASLAARTPGSFFPVAARASVAARRGIRRGRPETLPHRGADAATLRIELHQRVRP